jgi:acetolactate synthase I/II/III large subunit
MKLSAGAALLARLKAIGVDFVFANSGTDFPPLIEALADKSGRLPPLPEAIAIPHEHTAMGMAHGYYLATGKPQAVMAHTNVGLANCVIGGINAAAEHIPLFLFSGRTPVTEAGRFGSRSIPIGWGQEMRDQHAMVRELVKWDYELRFPEQVADLIDRAAAIAQSTPKGPVYMSLPRETLAEVAEFDDLTGPPAIAPAASQPSPDDIRRATQLLSKAKSPVIFAQGSPGSPAAFAALGELSETWAIPVVQYWATRLAVPTEHPMFAGAEVEPWLGEADVILIIDALAPWAPDMHKPRADCAIIQIGPDPLFSRFPARGYCAKLTLAGETSATLTALAREMKDYTPPPMVKRRYVKIAEATAAHKNEILAAAAEPGRTSQITKEWVSRCVSDLIADRPNAAVLSELGCPLGPMTISQPDCWFQAPNSGGLGWGLPAALGMQLADRSRLVIPTIGDGSYIFSNPLACHQVAEALELPVLTVILNNVEWGAVRTATNAMYPKGKAAKSNAMPLTSLAPQPDFVRVAEASRVWARRVTNATALPETLAEARNQVETTGRQALVDVMVAR